ncbi:MAG: UvrD-helicase domain-containing protein, partial [Acidimicrobiales bacterium]|nr:UvrD-helicase domain-containing protein [Acidimicrobiales bacterium]
MPRQTAPDQAARDRISTDLDTTLFVEAGAGSGKTTALVDRIASLLKTGSAEMREIAAITFTEKAAAELRDRVRQELEKAVAAKASSDELRDRCRAGLDQLDMAAVGTLHSFALRLLSESPIEAGLPPRVNVLDEVTSGLEFERRWSAFRDEMLADPSLERTILLLLASGVKPEALRVLAGAFDDNWDMVADRVPTSEPEPPDVMTLLKPLIAECRSIAASRGDCRDPGDTMIAKLDEFDAFASRLDAAIDEVAALETLSRELPNCKVGRAGRKGNWDDLDGLRARITDFALDVAETQVAVAGASARRIGVALREFTLGAAEERRASGSLEFHDLLVMARALLRDPVHGAAVRARLHSRYTRLLLDEFQDTDPVQIDLAVRIAAAAPGDGESGDAAWDGVTVTPGHLFVVGDPKQSIYRFRRADIATFIAARNRFGGEGDVVELSANFRTVRPVIEWVNATFGTLIQAVTEPVASQPAYVALQPVRDTPPQGPAVSVIGRDAHDKAPADVVRAREADDVRLTIQTVMADGWSVGDGEGGWRPARLGDITILVPARTSMPFLEEALSEAAIPYRAESSSLVYSTRAIRDLLMVLRAVDDPTNSLHVVSALRTPLLACGDDDLFRFKVERKGHWTYTGSQPDSVPADDPVRVGLEFLRALHDNKPWCSPSELLDRIARERRVFELGFADGRPRDLWRRARFVIDQARAWSEATGGSVREYLHWVNMQTAEGARVAEAVLPENDDDAVRIMTIHAAKGLEFPITIVSGMSSKPGGGRSTAQVVFPPGGGVGYKFGKHVQTEEYTEYVPIDEQMGHDERKRLLYVACTRARDHLVVSLHRRARDGVIDNSSATNAELLLVGMGSLLGDLPDAPRTDAPLVPHMPPAQAGALPPFEEWQQKRAEAIRLASRPAAVAATALAAEAALRAEEDEAIAGLKKRPRDLDVAPWLKGRYGTSLGRAVHGVLQTIDLATHEGLAAAVAAQCEAEAAESA